MSISEQQEHNRMLQFLGNCVSMMQAEMQAIELYTGDLADTLADYTYSPDFDLEDLARYEKLDRDSVRYFLSEITTIAKRMDNLTARAAKEFPPVKTWRL